MKTVIKYMGDNWMGGASDELKMKTFKYLLKNTPLELWCKDCLSVDPVSAYDGKSLSSKFGYGEISNLHFFGGNFWGISCSFSIHTNDPILISELKELIEENRQREDYKKQGKIFSFETLEDLDSGKMTLFIKRRNGNNKKYIATRKRFEKIESLGLNERSSSAQDRIRKAYFLPVKSEQDRAYFDNVFHTACRMVR